MISQREKEILKMLCLPNQIIAHRLNISLYTVKTYIKNLLIKLPDAKNRRSLIIQGLKNKIIELGDLVTE